MTPYANRGGDSNVIAYECGEDAISVQFGNGSVYLYTYARTGKGNVERMKALAAAGHGLNSFIKQHVNHAYAARLR